jgi:hypothetical protein
MDMERVDVDSFKAFCGLIGSIFLNVLARVKDFLQKLRANWQIKTSGNGWWHLTHLSRFNRNHQVLDPKIKLAAVWPFAKLQTICN